jgi:hypothetical protein
MSDVIGGRTHVAVTLRSAVPGHQPPVSITDQIETGVQSFQIQSSRPIPRFC